MIDLQYFALAINKAIGAGDFTVYLNTNECADIGKKITVSLAATRVPFGMRTSELDAESLAVTLTFDLTTAEAERDKVLFTIKNALLGWQTFPIAQPDGTNYIAETFFEQQTPANPYRDLGRLTQQIVVSGNALIRNVDSHATVGNNIHVYIDDTELLKVQRTTAMQCANENNLPLSEGGTLPNVVNVSHAHTSELTFIYTGKSIEQEFLKIAEGCEHDINKEYAYRVEYPDFIISVPIKILSVSITDSVGVFLQYRITIQTTAETLSEE